LLMGWKKWCLSTPTSGCGRINVGKGLWNRANLRDLQSPVKRRSVILTTLIPSMGERCSSKVMKYEKEEDRRKISDDEKQVTIKEIEPVAPPPPVGEAKNEEKVSDSKSEAGAAKVKTKPKVATKEKTKPKKPSRPKKREPKMEDSK